MSETEVKFKHQKDIDIHAPSDCPPTNAASVDVIAFRWVHNPIVDDDFKTHVGLKKLPRQTEQIHHKCMRCGLSMFNSLEKAVDKYNGVKGTTFGKELTFTHVAKGEIVKTDGKCTPPKKDGHFTLHEYFGVEKLSVFKIVLELKEANG